MFSSQLAAAALPELHVLGLLPPAGLHLLLDGEVSPFQLTSQSRDLVQDVCPVSRDGED